MCQPALLTLLPALTLAPPFVLPLPLPPYFKINFCGKLALDPSPQVRLALVQVLGDWMLNLSERMDHEHRLLPYLLGALNDSDTSVKVRFCSFLQV
jgi:hypothetical protein